MNSLRSVWRKGALVGLLAFGALAVAGRANPTGGSVAAGSATIASAGNTLTVTQASGRAIINWQDFSNRAGELTRFIQPDAASATLNRVISGQPSALFGDIQANGKVFLINPNGILVGAGARIDTGGFLASTLDVANQDFLAGGDLHFTGNSTAAVKNLGAVNALGGDVFLIARAVESAGTVTAGGTAGLAAGSEILLTTGGSERLFVLAGSSPGTTVNSGTITGTTAELKAAGGNAYAFAINNTGLVRATGTAERGGKLWLVAEGGDIANGGTLDVSSATGQGGEINVKGDRVSLDPASRLDASGATGGGTMFVLGGAEVNVDGALDARATSSGDGGFIETSADHVRIANTPGITTVAAAGAAGTWLIDPNDFTIAASGGDMTGADVVGFLGGNLTIASSVGGTDGNGNIYVNDTVSWSAHKLTLSAQNNIYFNAAVTASGTASLALEYGQGAVASGNTSDYYVNAAVTLPEGNNFSTKLGSDGTVKTYTVITSLGAQGSTTATDLQGMNGNLAANYALGANIDASATSSWNSGAGLQPIGTVSTSFTGTFTGLGHTISGLTINRPSTDYVGLFGYTSNAVIRNVGLVGGSVSGHDDVGGLAGFNSLGTITNSYATGSVSGNESVGGLAGFNQVGTITNSYATGSVSGTNYVGGLEGFNAIGTITNSYATGSVSGTSNAGGLVGYNSLGTITTSYATGSVSGTSATGGLVGYNNAGTVTNSYWNTTTSGQATSSGGTGLTTTQMRTASNFAGFNFTTTPGETGNAWVMIDDTGSLNNAGGTGAVLPMLASEFSTTITNAHQLQLMAMARGESYTLAADLDVAATGNSHDVWDSAGFVPVGNTSARFNGTFDGLGHTISNLTINRSSNDRIGLFGQTGVGAEILNVGLVDASVTGHTYVGTLVGLNAGRIEASSASGSVTGAGDRVGGLAGLNTGSIIDSHATSAISGLESVGGLVGYGSAGTIDGSYATGAISGEYYVGGLVGYNTDGGTIDDSYATGAVTGTGSRVGGLVGYDDGTISDSHATGSVTGSSSVGGLVGYSAVGTIEDSYATGAVTGTGDYSGGLLGESLGATINRSHATGNVSGGGWYVGGLVGNISSGGTISFTYATGSVSGGGDYVGGLVGNNDANLSASYATGTASGTNNVGGLVGDNTGTISKTYATGNATGSGGWVGGLVGVNNDPGSITDSYATGNASAGSQYVGGLVGNNLGQISNTYATGTVSGTISVGGLAGNTNGSTGSTDDSYWNKDVSPQLGDGGTGLTTAEIQQQASFTGWDFASTWIIYEGHTTPLLRTFMTPLTVTANNATKTYNGLTSAAGNGVTYSATPNPNLLGTVTYTGGGANVGTQTLTPGDLYSHQQGYAITFAPGTLTINPATLTYTANAASRTVGAADPAFSGTVAGFVNSETQSSATTGTLSFTTTATNASPVGSYALTGSGLTANNGNYVFVQAPSNATAFTIGALTSVPLTITANDATRLYGAANPAFTASYAGFINGDTSSVLTGLQFSTTATISSNVGTYTITPYGATAPTTYLIGYVPGTLTINPAALSYTANAASRPFGAANPAFSGTVTGFVNGDTQGTATTGTLSFSTTATSSSPVGSYALTGAGLTANFGNYVFAQAPGNATAFTIGSPTSVPLTITADNKTKTYGAALPAFTASYAGFINNDTAASVTGLQFSTTATASSNVGTFTITPFGATAPAAYSIGYVPGTLTINPAALTLFADNKSRAFGAANPPLTASFSGFVNGDTAAVGSGLQFSTTATTGSNVGTYTITPFGASVANYTLSYVSGLLAIDRSLLTISADNQAKTYGATLPAFTASYTGLVNGDTSSVVSGLQFSTTATTGSNVGTYTVTPFGAAASNYSLAYVPGTLTVNPAALTLTANNAEREFGAANPAFAGIFSGFVNGDTAAVVTGLQFSTPATAASVIGDHPITPSGATAANYTLTFVDGTLRVVAPTVMVGGAPVPVIIIGGQPVLTASLALIQEGDRLAFVFLGSSDDGRTATHGASVDERLALTLGETAGARPAAVDPVRFSGTNLGGFTLITALPASSSADSVSSLLSPEQMNEPGLFRETSVSQGRFDIIYQEALTSARQQTDGNTAAGSSYREFFDAEKPETNLVRPKADATSPNAAAGGNAGVSL